ncbi:MAG: 1-deoxy-D-xylulose-5-phosphate synthase [Fibrobacterota bacterium]
MSLLENINSPADLKKLERKDLSALAEEIRERILSVVSETGGHLAPSLGVVELTIALHYVYESPEDRIVWDVGHQAYPHKILTGRNPKFPTIRQHGGLSGYPRRSESPHDAFDVGHASTSISAALGMACARDVKKDKRNIVAVIGDGSMTGGLAYEGLNNAGHLRSDITVVLNDNKMSISPNVGAMSRYLSRALADPRFNKLKDDVWSLMGRLSGFGKGVRSLVSRIDDSVKTLIMPGRLFEELGFSYFGPIDGHDTSQLIDIFGKVRDLPGPKLVHVITRKGKGYHHAESNASKFHGIGSFRQETGEVKKTKKKTYSAIFGESICKHAERNNDIAAITAGMTDGTGLKAFSEKFPERFFDVGIAEGHAVTFAGGLAASGIKPVVAIYSTFLQRAYDNIIHDIALQNLPVIFCLDRAGLVGDDGPTHHGVFDLSFLRTVPGAVIMAPSSGAELEKMIDYALNSHKKGPVFIRYPRGEADAEPALQKYQEIEIGKMRTFGNGEDVLLVSAGNSLKDCLEIMKILEKDEIGVTIADMRFVKPIDSSVFELIKSHKIAAVAESNTMVGGIYGAVCEGMKNRETPVVSLGIPDKFINHGNNDLLKKEIGIDPESCARLIKGMLS